jgi:hypothetical protein
MIDFAGIAAHPGRDLRREQTRDNSIFVRRPDGAIQADERCTRILFPAKAKRAVEQAINEPLEAKRHLVELPAKLRFDAINHLAAYHRFADRRFLAPLRLVLEEVEDSDEKVVVGLQQSCASGDNPVTVVVGVAIEGKLKAVLHPYQPFHRKGRGSFMRIWPSQSAVMKRKVGSTVSLTTVRFNP